MACSHVLMTANRRIGSSGSLTLDFSVASADCARMGNVVSSSLQRSWRLRSVTPPSLDRVCVDNGHGSDCSAEPRHLDQPSSREGAIRQAFASKPTALQFPVEAGDSPATRNGFCPAANDRPADAPRGRAVAPADAVSGVRPPLSSATDAAQPLQLASVPRGFKQGCSICAGTDPTPASAIRRSAPRAGPHRSG